MIETSSEGPTTHGGKRSRLYGIWCTIKTRCYNSNREGYHNYGARGIVLAPEWHDFAVFRAAVGEPPSDRHTIDRIDNDRGYEPGNVRWATSYRQSNNRRVNTRITHDGRTQTLAEWASEVLIPYRVLAHRLAKGKTFEEAVMEGYEGTARARVALAAVKRFATEALEAGGLDRLVLAAQGVVQNRSSAEHRQAAIDYLETALADLGIRP